jgi:hypothetical protein
MKRRNAAVNNGRHRPGSMAHAVLHADQAQPVRRIRRMARGAKLSAAGMGVEPIPGGQA